MRQALLNDSRRTLAKTKRGSPHVRPSSRDGATQTPSPNCEIGARLPRCPQSHIMVLVKVSDFWPQRGQRSAEAPLAWRINPSPISAHADWHFGQG